MNHPCHNFSCPEYNRGQCFGGGCRTNPMPEPSEREDDDDDNEKEDDDDYRN